MADDGIAYVGDTSGDEFLDVTFYAKQHNGVDTDFVNIKVPGDKTLEIDEVATETHMRRFGRKWQMYKAMQTMTGTPVMEFDDIPEGLKHEFIYLGFKFVEQIAGAPDSAFARVPGGTQWRIKAQAYLNRGKVSADEMIKKQQEQIDALMAQMAQITGNTPAANMPAEEPARRGRKPKETVE
jgi:hypothetical protein